jgi:hypothetical protein
MILSIGFVAFASFAAAGLYAHRDAPPTCDSEQALSRVGEVMRDEYHLDSTFLNNIRTVSGGFFSDSHECSAEVTEIRGNVNASDMPWREVRYQIVRREKSEHADITVRLGGAVPLAGPSPSLWARLIAHL